MNEYERGFQNGATSGYGEAQQQYNNLRGRINDVAVKLADRWPFTKNMNPYDQLDAIEGVVEDVLDLLKEYKTWTDEAIIALDEDEDLFGQVMSIFKILPKTEDGKFICPGVMVWIAHNFGGLITVTPEDWTSVGVLMQQGKVYSNKESAMEAINSDERETTDDNG
jgi:hypothetical protein